MAEFPNAKRYTDFRKMLLEMDDQIDAVGIATQDHMPFLPAYMAIMMGKHVYIQKPLTPTVGEARELLRVLQERDDLLDLVLGLLDLRDGRPRTPDGEEEFRILVEARRVVTPVHGETSFLLTAGGRDL